MPRSFRFMPCLSHSRPRVALLALLAFGFASFGPAPIASAELGCGTLPEFAQLFLRNHVRHNQLTDEVKRRAISNYILRLDRSRMLLTQPEADALESKLAGAFDELNAGRCNQLTDVQKQFVRMHESAAKFVRKTVEPDDYAIDEEAKLTLDPEERGYPENAGDRDDLMRRMIHFQISNYVSNGAELDEAKGKLIKRYERRFKRELEVSTDDIYSAFLDSFASALDPHSNYLSRQVLEDFRIGMSLSLEGIGVALSEQDGYAVAERIIPGGAAEKHGVLKEQDKLIAVSEAGDDFVDIIDMPLRDAVSLIRGKAGTTVGLTVLRKDGEELKKFNTEIVRAKIDLAEQAAQLRFEEREVKGKKVNLAILELPSFYGDADPSKRQCTDDVAKLLAEVEKAKADGLLLDLSRNGGGLLQHAVEISGFFIREGEVVGIQDSRGHRQILSDNDERVLYSGPMVVHTSRVSASASEILAGALKDYGRAVIVGDDHTFGKGTVQTVSQLPGENGALKVTTALFFRPGGRSTQHSGVDADVVLPSLLASDDYGEKTQRYSLPPQATAPFLGSEANGPDSTTHWEPIDTKTMVVLAQNSAGRIADDDDFAEIRERLAEQQESNGVIELSEILKRREESDGEEEKNEGDGEKKPKDEATPQLEEALRVLSDLVALSWPDVVPTAVQAKDAGEPAAAGKNAEASEARPES